MDNSNLPAKLELRRHFLRAYHPRGRRRVFDGFQGSGLIWTALAKEFPLDNYWGVDLLAKKGRLKIDSCRILSQPGWQADLVDLDAYGSPWKHWLGILSTFARSATRPERLTIFLTLGSRNGIQKRPLTKMEKSILGIPFDIPPMIGAQLGARRVRGRHAAGQQTDPIPALAPGSWLPDIRHDLPITSPGGLPQVRQRDGHGDPRGAL